MSVAAAWLPSVLSALAEQLASLWPFLLPLGALILAVAGLSLAQEASYHRSLNDYREQFGGVLGHAWSVHGPQRAYALLEDLPTFPETAVQRRRRLRAEKTPRGWPAFEAVAVLRDRNFGQHTQLEHINAASAIDGLHAAAERMGLWSSNDTQHHGEIQVRVGDGLVVATGPTYLIAVRPAPPPIRLWLLRRWS